MPRTRRSIIKSLVFGLLVAVLFTLAAMLALAAALVFLRFSDRLLTVFNQIIKQAAVVLGVIAAVPRGSQRGLATGVLIALAYTVIGYAMYVALGGSGFSVTGMLGELLLGVTVGAVTGAVRANMQPKGRITPRNMKT